MLGHRPVPCEREKATGLDNCEWPVLPGPRRNTQPPQALPKTRGLRPVLNSQFVEELVLRSEGGHKQMHDDLDELKSGQVEWPDEPPVARIAYGVHL